MFARVGGKELVTLELWLGQRTAAAELATYRAEKGL